MGAIAVVLGLLAVIFPTWFTHGEGWLIGVPSLGISILYGIYRGWPAPVERSFSTPNITVRIVKGDLFEQPGHLVIGMCDTFDTSTPKVIAPQSVQGQFMLRLLNDDVDEFDRRLTKALGAVVPSTLIAKVGKQQKYPLGTVAILSDGDRCIFCLAYTEMNVKNEARATVNGIWRSLDSLWVEVSQHANGGVVAMPVIGQGLARISHVLSAADSIRLIVLSFFLASRTERFCDGLDVVIRPKDYEQLDRLEVQAFLNSLGAS